MSINMPIQQESDFESKKGGGGTPPKELWRGLPLKAGTSHTNNVLIPAFSPHNWEMFNPTPEMAQKYRMVGSGLQGMVADNPLTTFYFKMPVHAVPNFQRPDGSIGFSDVLCPIELNKYLVEAIGRNPLFAAPVRCAHCDEEKRRWDAHNAQWDAIGIDKKSLSTDGYRAQIDGDPVLKSTRKAARDMQVRDRYVLSIFDLDKMLGVRPLDDGETGVEKQIWLSPVRIKDKLVNLWNARLNFCENTQAGFPVLGITKDTHKCTANNMMKTEWDVIAVGRFQQLEEAWINYITDMASMVDPSKFVHMVTYEEAMYYIQSASEDDQGGNSYEQGTAPVGNPAGFPQGSSPVVAPPGMGGGMPPGMGGGMPPTSSTPMMPASYSPVDPAGMPPQGMPPQGMPPQGMPPQGMPPQGMPPQGMPPQGMPPQGMPPQGAPAGMPPQGMPPQGMPPQGMPPQGMPPQGAPAGMPPQGMPPQGMPPQGMPPQGMPPQGGPPVPAQPAAPQGIPASSPVNTIPAASDPPSRGPAPPPAGGEGPAKRRW